MAIVSSAPDETATTGVDEGGIVATAKARFERAKSFYGQSRILSEADTRFAMGDSDNGWQWPQQISQQRTTANKVMLTVNTTAQHCNQVINEIRKNRPSGSVSPVDGGADKETANILAGLIRNILTSSNADDAHDVAAEHSIYGGEGYWRITTDYESETSFDQVIKIGVLPNPNNVYIDVDAKELDKCDALWGFIFDQQNKDEAKRLYGVDASTWVDNGQGNDGWFDDKTYLRAEYYWCEQIKDTACMYVGMDGTEETAFKSDEEKIRRLIQAGFMQAIGKDGKPLERETFRKVWYHCFIIGGHDRPIEKQVWVGAYLPIISVVGKEVNVNGEIIRKGLVRDLKDPARIVNYAYSETVQTLALQNKIPYIAAVEAIEGHETAWQGANVSNDAVLPWNAFDSENRPLPVPQRQPPAVLPDAQISLLTLSLDQMRGASGQQNANFGIKSDAQSGIGIQRLKVQGEIATFHFPDNLARGLKFEWKQLVDLIPKIYTRKKIVRILGLDGKEDHAELDPELPGAFHEVRGEKAVERIFNPNVGRYDIAISTGPSFETQRQESSQMMIEFAKADPTLMAKAGDLIMRAQDYPGSDEMAERLAKFLPPGIADDDGGPEAQVAKLTQQIQEMQQESQQHIEEGLRLEEENQRLKSGEAAKMASVQTDREKAAAEGDLARKKAAAELQLKREQAAAEDQLAREKADQEAETARYKIDREAEVKAYAAEVNARVTERTAGLNAQVQLAGHETNADVAKAGQQMKASAEKSEEKPEKKKRSLSVSMPSGRKYKVSMDGDDITVKE